METGSNLTTYLEWLQTHDLPRLTVTVPDGMVFSELCYLDFSPSGKIAGRTLGSVCQELLAQDQIKTMGLGDPAAFYPFIKALATNRRFAPLIILRAISDKADDSAEMDYPTFERIAAHRCAAVTQALARHLREAEDQIVF